jgi:glycosyltransferase involved in cell wall biosynthesis
MTLATENKLSGNQISFPLISIITIVRNGMPFIEQAIKSVIGQRYGNFEYIVIDGGSSDSTVNVIKSHEAGIKKWISEKDHGIADAFNKGLSFASGDYVLFLNSDDALATPNILEQVAGLIAVNAYPVLLYGDYNIIERDSGEIMYHGRVDFSPEKLKYGQVLPHPCLFSSRGYFEKYGNFDTGFRIAMDYEWLLRGVQIERVVQVPLLVTNIRSGGISALDRKQVVKEIIAALKKNKYIVSKAGEYKLRAYFYVRLYARNILNYIGLYRLFFKLRNRIKKWVN